MKRLFPSLLIALASTAIVAATPTATPAVQHTTAPAAFSPEHLTVARQYVALIMSPDKTMTDIRANATMASASYAEGIEDEAQREVARRHYYDLMASYEPKIQALLPGLMEAYAHAYAREYSADELSQIISFAHTPAGKHYFTHPDYFDDDPAVEESRMAIGKLLMPAMEQMNKEACAAKAAARVAAGDKHAKCPLAG